MRTYHLLYHPGRFQVFTVTDKWESVSQAGATSRGMRPLLSLQHVSPARPASLPALLWPVFPLAVLVGEDPTGGVGSDGKSRHLHEGPAFRRLRCGSSTAECLIPTGWLPAGRITRVDPVDASFLSRVALCCWGADTALTCTYRPRPTAPALIACPSARSPLEAVRALAAFVLGFTGPEWMLNFSKRFFVQQLGEGLPSRKLQHGESHEGRER